MQELYLLLAGLVLKEFFLVSHEFAEQQNMSVIGFEGISIDPKRF